MASEGPKALDPAAVAQFEAAVTERKNKPFFEVLPAPRYPACDHSRRGVILDKTTRTVTCKCGAPIDAFDALLIYMHVEKRLVSTREAIERHEKEKTDKAKAEAEKKPFLMETRGFSSVYNPAPPNGDGALIGYDVKLSCGHLVRYGSKGRRRPTQRMTCHLCLRLSKKDLVEADRG